jgi:hypothetical protein
MHWDDDDAELLWKDTDFSMADMDRSSFVDLSGAPAGDTDDDDDDGKKADEYSTGQQDWKTWGGGKMDDDSMNCCQRF